MTSSHHAHNVVGLAGVVDDIGVLSVKAVVSMIGLIDMIFSNLLWALCHRSGAYVADMQKEQEEKSIEKLQGFEREALIFAPVKNKKILTNLAFQADTHCAEKAKKLKCMYDSL